MAKRGAGKALLQVLAFSSCFITLRASNDKKYLFWYSNSSAECIQPAQFQDSLACMLAEARITNRVAVLPHDYCMKQEWTGLNISSPTKYAASHLMNVEGIKNTLKEVITYEDFKKMRDADVTGRDDVTVLNRKHGINTMLNTTSKYMIMDWGAAHMKQGCCSNLLCAIYAFKLYT